MATTPVEPSKVTSSLTALSAVNSSQGLKIGLTELNPHFVCVLCFGYFVDATTITECMHTFCKSCIVNFLQSNHHCPHCDTLLSRTRPFNSLRPDRMMQTLVYKTVPGLFQTEMRRRIQFYQSHPLQELEPDVEDIQNYIFSPEDSVSLSIRYYNAVSQIAGDDIWDAAGTNSKNNMDVDDINAIRYFRCPATVPMSVLKALVKTKYGIPDPFRVELLYGEERLLDTWTLMEVAYIFKWNRDSPMELSFQVFVTRKVKRKRLRLVKKPKVKDKENESNVSLGNQEETREEDDTSSEPPLKIPRIREPYRTSPEEHHQRPPTPPETPDGPADINVYTDNIKSPKSSPSWFPSPRRDTSGSLKIILKSTNVVTRRKDNKASSSSSEDDEPKERINSAQSEMDPFDKLMEETNSKFIDDSRKYDQDDNMDNDDCPMDEDGDSGDYAGDQDSEAPLEVDTSHETEPEADNDGDVDFSQEDLDTYKQEYQKEDDIDEEEQGDSAIDVTETSASEVVDSDDKDTDFNMSSESIDIASHCRKVSGHNGTIENIDSKVKTEESFSDHSENSDCNKDIEGNNSNSSGVPDMGGALDLSCHARTVRAQRENSQSPGSSSNYLSSDNETKMQGLQSLLTTSPNGTPKQSPNGSPMHGQQSPLLKTSTNVVTGTNHLTSSLVTSPRPPLPLDWVRPPMGNGPALPHAAAFNLMTLSQAAVQLQLAMAHHAQAQVQAQVHAQAHVQAQAQKIQAQVQANVLKNLKATETLSFVNGSGDTLTISPIPCNQGNIAKSKLTTKMKSVKNITANHNSLNYNKTASAKSKLFNNQKNVKSNKEHSFQNGVSSINKSSSSNTNNNTSTTNNNKVHNTQHTANGGKTSQNNSLKTVIPKSALTSLRIPTVSLHTKTHAFKSDKEKKQAEKERTGDPVFKITNQKLIEFVRQQHLHKLKQSSKQNPSTDGNPFKTSNDCISATVNITSKPTLAVVPTSIADGGNKVSCNNNNASNKFGKNTFLNKPATSTILNKSQSNPNSKAISSSQIKSPVSSIGKSQPSLSKSSITPSKPQPTINKPQSTSLVKPMQPPSLNKGPISSISKPQQLCVNKSQVSILNKPQSPNQIKPSQSPTFNKPPQSPTLNKPLQSPTSNKPPQSPTLNKSPQSPALHKPPTLNKPPQSPTLNKPPQSPTLTKPPHSPTSNKPQPPSLNKPLFNPNKTTINSSNKSIILNKSPMISLNKITVNSVNKPAVITSVTKQPNSFANNSVSSNTNDSYTNNNNVTINGSNTTSQCNSDGSLTKSIITPKQLTLTSSSPVTPPVNTLRTTNTNVRQIPNPSRLTHQAENRLSSGIRLGTLTKKGVTTSKSEGMSRIESLTRTLHEKASAASGVAAGVLSSFAR